MEISNILLLIINKENLLETLNKQKKEKNYVNVKYAFLEKNCHSHVEDI